jgi:predicted nucleic acid-binding protein
VRIYFLWRPNLPDEADNHIVELAIAGGAEVIVTNNTSDLRGGELSFPQLQVLTPAQFLKTINAP